MSTPSRDRRPASPEAVAQYELGITALQEHHFGAAADAFRAVLAVYPEEKELGDRARLYLALCEREIARTATPAAPATREDHLFAATLALNAGDAKGAMEHLAAVVHDEPDHDGALYMMGVAHALSGDSPRALACLQRAVERNPENRVLALQDADLERLLQDESVRASLQAAAGAAADTRRGSRSRTLR